MKNKTVFLTVAHEHWGDPLPDWLTVLCEECQRTSAVKVAKRIGCSSSLLSNLIRNKYPGDVDVYIERIRGALMGVTVKCPVLGEIPRDRCLSEQREPFRATSAIRTQLYRACRNNCPHSKLEGS